MYVIKKLVFLSKMLSKYQLDKSLYIGVSGGFMCVLYSLSFIELLIGQPKG